jgi:tetratricopeptide (TPR) repeat protein
VLALDPKDYGVAANLALSYACLRDFDRAEDYARLTVTLAPDKTDGYAITSYVLARQGRYREAREVLESAPGQDPWVTELIVEMEIGERRFDDALARLEENPDAVYEASWGKESGALIRAVQQCDCYFFLGDRRGISDACGRARDLAEERVAVEPENERVRGALGRVLAALGRKEAAIREGKKAVELLPVSREARRGPYYIKAMAVIYTRIGEPDAAIDQLEYLFSIPDTTTVGQLRNHPNWDPLRDHPRFQALLEKYDAN